MNQKIIKKILRGKLNAWINSIEDSKVQELVRRDTIVTGGAITSLLMNEKPKDFDVYFKTKETVKAVATYYVDRFNKEFPETGAMVIDGADYGDTFKPVSGAGFQEENRSIVTPAGFAGGANLTPDRIKIGIKSRGVASRDPDLLKQGPIDDAVDALTELDENQEDNLDLKPDDKKFKVVFLSSNAITLNDQIQIVVRFYGSPDEIHTNYDFTHCTNSYDYKENELSLRQEALECILAKELLYQGSKYPLCSIIRTRKFLKRGWHINAGQYLKMMFQVSQLDLTDINVLEDQLVGVDSAYFGQLIDALRSKEESDPSFKVDAPYLTTIIDRLF